MEDGRQIIVIEDDPGIQDAIKLALEHEGYLLTQFSNGEAILAGNYEEPALFIIDKLLPGVDGLDICRHLKTQETSKDIPVLMLSASPQVAAQAKAACADDFLEKPFKMKAFRTAIERLIRKDQE